MLSFADQVTNLIYVLSIILGLTSFGWLFVSYHLYSLAGDEKTPGSNAAFMMCIFQVILVAFIAFGNMEIVKVLENYCG